MLTVTMIGTAATLPLPQRATASAAIGYRGRWLILDCGEGTQVAARQAGISLVKTDAVCLTHYHGDHIFGLPGLLQTMGTMERREPLTIIGPAGLEAAMAPILALAGDELPYPVRLMTLPPEGIVLSLLHPAWTDQLRLQAFETQHRVCSQGYKVTLARAGKFQADRARTLGIPQRLWREVQQGHSVTLDGQTIQPSQVLSKPRRGLKVVFSGDTAPCETLENAARDADLLICDATYPTQDYADKAELFGHSTYGSAAALAARAQVRRLWLTHYSAMIARPEEFLPQAQAHFSQTVCTADGMTETLTFADD